MDHTIEIRETPWDIRSPSHTKHSIVQMIRQRVYQMAAGYEDSIAANVG